MRAALWAPMTALALSAGALRAEASDDVATAALQPPEGTVVLTDVLRRPALALPSALREKLRVGDWSGALPALLAAESPADPREALDLDVLRAWVLVEAGRAAEAEVFLDKLTDDSSTAPAGWRWSARAAIHRAMGDAEAAIEDLGHIPAASAHAGKWGVERARALVAAGRVGEADATLAPLLERPDDADAQADVVELAATLAPPATAEALWRKLRSTWPASDAARRASEAGHPDLAGAPWTFDERLRLVEGLLSAKQAGAALQALLVTDPPVADGLDQEVRVAEVRARATLREGGESEALAVLRAVPRNVVETVSPAAKRAAVDLLVLRSELESKASKHADLVATVEAVTPHLDGDPRRSVLLARAAEAHVALGAADAAVQALVDALTGQPTSSALQRAAWKAAFTAYDAGRPGEAVAIARALCRTTTPGDAYLVAAGCYWAPRWTLYPDVHAPNVESREEGARAAAIAGWRDVLEHWPQNYYALLAFSRLVELAPDVAASVGRKPVSDEAFGPWWVHADLLADPRFREGVDLLRFGLVSEGLAVLDPMALRDRLSPDEAAWLVELRVAAGDWIAAQQWMQKYLKYHPVGSLGVHEPHIVAVGYPDRWWAEIQEATRDYAWPARMFHGLVRTESAFNPSATSRSGARGLSQIMPTTGAEIASRMGLRVSTEDLHKPELNLKMGAWYIDRVQAQLYGNPIAAQASYNGGPGRMKRYIEEWPGMPTDEVIERIPIDEMRGYPREVSTAWQVMRYAYDLDTTPFVDLSKFNHDPRGTLPDLKTTPTP
jgi:soluble lytic murein transglycosylase